jgi:hypothetical protein
MTTAYLAAGLIIYNMMKNGSSDRRRTGFISDYFQESYVDPALQKVDELATRREQEAIQNIQQSVVQPLIIAAAVIAAVVIYKK